MKQVKVMLAHLLFSLEKIHVKNFVRKQSPQPSAPYGWNIISDDDFLWCIFKFDGQNETVHVCNLTRLVFFNGVSITLQFF